MEGIFPATAFVKRAITFGTARFRDGVGRYYHLENASSADHIARA